MDFKASRWTTLEETSPSGKRLFRCSVCERVSTAPDKTCRTVGDPEETKKCSRYDELTIHRYYLPSLKGEGWAIVYITSLGEFTALSDYGNYGYWWSHHGCKDIREFFLRALKDPGYFVGKLSGGATEYDGEASLKSVKQYILSVRRDKSWTKECAREEWDLLDMNENLYSDHDFTRWYDHTQIDEAYEHHQRRAKPQVVAFVEKVLGRLEPILRAELGLPEEGKDP